jgi:CIC family chloride channel protein
MAGAIFVLEELVRRFEPRIAIAALGASATAISVSRMLLGQVPDFHVEALAYGDAATRPLYFALGAVAGLMAIGYNRILLGTIAAAERVGGWPLELRAGLIGAAVGTLAWFAPDLAGGGDPSRSAPWLGRNPVLLPVVFWFGFARRRVVCRRNARRLFAPMLVLERSSACYLDLLPDRFPDLNIQPKDLPSSGWRPFSSASSGRH